MSKRSKESTKANSPEALQHEKGEKDKLCRRLHNLIQAIQQRLPECTPQYITKEILLMSPQALGQALNGGRRAKTYQTYLDKLKIWLQENKHIAVTLNEVTDIFTLEVPGKSTGNETGNIEVVEPLDFLAFMKEVQNLTHGGGDVKIIGAWPSAIIGEGDNADGEDATTPERELKRMSEKSKSVKILLPKPDCRFFAKRLYTQYYNNAGEFEHRRNDLFVSLEILNKIKQEINDPNRFDFRVYDGNPAMRMFVHTEKIFTSFLLGHVKTSRTFGTVYPNKSEAAEQLIGHFDHLWKISSEYQSNNYQENYKMLPLNDLPGIYKVYTYGHTGESPATVVGSLEIKANGAVHQRTFRSESSFDVNEGWVRRVGDNLFMEVRNTRAPKFTAYSIIRKDSGFEAQPGQYLFGVIIVPKQVGSTPIALRILLERQPDNTKMDELPCGKYALSDEIDAGIVPPEIRKVLSGIFRNMLRYHDSSIFNNASLEKETTKTKVDLGKVLFAYALSLKYASTLNVKNGSDEEMTSAVRWALTHGYTDWQKAETEFDDLIKKHPPTLKIFEKVKKENPGEESKL